MAIHIKGTHFRPTGHKKKLKSYRNLRLQGNQYVVKMGFKSWFSGVSSSSSSSSAPATLNGVTLTASDATLVVNNSSTAPAPPSPKKKTTYNKRENYGTIDKVPEEVMTRFIEVHKKLIKASYEKYGTTRRNLPTVDMAEEELNEAIIYNDKYAYIEQDGYWVSAWAAQSDRVEEELIKFCNELFTYVDADTETYDPAKHHLYPRRRHPYILNYRQGHRVGYEILFVKNL
jgi:hypothetical protein